jgi:hypothetical protein
MIEIKTIITGAALLFTVGALAAAQSGTSPLAAACADDVDSLQHRIEQDYGGFRLEVTGDRLVALRDTLAALRRAAPKSPGADCYPALRALTEWYHDPHLFVYQAPVATDAPVARRALGADQARAFFAERLGVLDPIEGIWYDGALRVAVIPVEDNAPGRYEAVILRPDTAGWNEGDVRATLTKRGENRYDVILRTPTRGTQQLTGIIYKRVMLRLSPGIWGKEYPIAPADSGLLHPANAHRATFRFRDGTATISIPSHDPTYRSTLDSLLTVNDALLRSAERLIVDLRGNEGGSSGVTNGLLPFIESDPRRPTPYDADTAMMLSSPDQIRYATRAFGAETSPFVRGLLERLRAHPGEFVRLSDPSSPPPTRNVPIFGPKAIAVLVDGGTVSAAEVLVLNALASTRAIVVGEPTEGALDYQSTTIVWFSSQERRWGLGYPTITRNLSLPRNGMRGKGIPPDVRIEWRKIADPIGYADALLRARR